MSQSPNVSANTRVAQLDYLRGVAIALVVMFHYAITTRLLAATLTVAALSWVLIEGPCVRYGKRHNHKFGESTAGLTLGGAIQMQPLRAKTLGMA
jgi:peptidoglycan/LPS O-acetylase OafA/YrhL